MSAYSMSLIVILTMAAAAQTAAQTALSDWMPGVATNYGGPSEGMDPNSPSYGLSNVSLTLFCTPMPAFLLESCHAQSLFHAAPQSIY